MNIKRNIIVEGAEGKSLLADVYSSGKERSQAVVVFAHGFKGFKDWGIWDLLAKSFVNAGYVFIKFNFSHNGTTLDAPLDFGDLDAFGQNNYSKELADIEAVLNKLETGYFLPLAQIDLNRICLVGHSRGGGTTAIKSTIDDRVAAWIGWASVKDLAYAWRGNQALIDNWKKTGSYEINNSRTNQMMPLYYQLFEDFVDKESAYDVQKAIREMTIPMLVIHGTADAAVPWEVTNDFRFWNEKVQVALISGANHVFGGSHPYKGNQLPSHAQELLEASLLFLKKNIKED